MAKRRRSPIVGHVINAGLVGESASPAGEYYVTEDGRKLTPDEAFLRPGDPAGPGGRKGPTPATVAAAVALMHYHDEVGLDVHGTITELADKIADYASTRGLPGADLLEPAGGSMRTLIAAAVESLKQRA